MRPDPAVPPPPQDLKGSTLEDLRKLELALSDLGVRDAMESGADGLTLAQGEVLLHDIHLLTTDIVNGRLGILLSAATANEPELQAASKEMNEALKDLTNIKNLLDKATKFLGILTKLAGCV